MEKSLSVKNYIILLRGDIRIWISEKEFKAVERIIETKQFINLNGRIFNTSSVMYVGPRREIDIADKIKKGYWQCEYGYWHGPGEKCAHGELEKYNTIDTGFGK